MRLERIERRVLGALTFVDATTGRRLDSAMDVSAADTRFARNDSGMYVVFTARSLDAYTQAFDPTPAAPAPVTIAGTVADPSGTYLARRFTVAVPRDTGIGSPLPANSVFEPARVRMFPAPAAPTAPNWATVRAHVKRGDQDVAGALVRVIRQSNGARLGTGISDSRGEVLVTVPGIALVNWDQGAGPVLATQIDVRLETVFDASAGTPPDPDSLDGQAAASTVNARLGAGDVLIIGLTVPG